MNNKNQKRKNNSAPKSKPRSSDNRERPKDRLKNQPTISGTVIGNAKGFGFFKPDGGGEDIFIAPRDLRGATDGDRAEIIMVSKIKNSGEGRVVKVLERNSNCIVGTYKSDYKGYGFVSPDNSGKGDVYIAAKDSGGAHDGDKVTIDITDFPKGRNPEGKVTEILGKPGDIGVNVLSVIRSYKLREVFPPEVLRECSAAAVDVSDDELKGREDFTEHKTITIDGDDSKDFDDAVYLEKTKKGGYTLYVHIADVTHYVPYNGAIDSEAYKRGTSVYFADRVIPMLPEKLSNGICSLNEGVKRLTLSVVMEFSPSGEPMGHRVVCGVIKSCARMTYGKVTKILEGDAQLIEQYAHLTDMLRNMEKLSSLLHKRRAARGSIEFDISESYITVDEKGRATGIEKKPRLVAHKIIEEFMLITNEAVAKKFFDLKAPFVYRSHVQPPFEKVEALQNFLKPLSVEFETDAEHPQPMDFSKMLEKVPDNVKPIVNRVALRSMTKASYEPVNNGHFGLASEFYCHFTSPIRRYPDLTIHRIIKDYLKNGEACFKKYKDFVGKAAQNSSVTERVAEEAERKVDDVLKAEYMSDKIGQQFDGTVSGITEWGIFVELENSVEGLVRAETLKGHSYTYDPVHLCLYNEISRFTIGDKVSITVDAVTTDKISFTMNE